MRSGTAIQGLPVYSDPDPVDFVYHWLRISWAEVFPGRLVDQSGDTLGHHICCVRSIGYPLSSSVRETRRGWSVDIEASVTVSSHPAQEESYLEPDSVFAVATVTRTFALTFELSKDPNGFLVRRVHLRPYSAEGATLIQRYGGRVQPYIWSADPD